MQVTRNQIWALFVPRLSESMLWDFRFEGDFLYFPLIQFKAESAAGLKTRGGKLKPGAWRPVA